MLSGTKSSSQSLVSSFGIKFGCRCLSPGAHNDSEFQDSGLMRFRSMESDGGGSLKTKVALWLERRIRGHESE